MESKHEKRKAVFLEALEILRDSRKIPPSSSSLVEEVDSLPPAGNSSESLVPDGGELFVKEPQICSGALDVVVDASEIMDADDPGSSNFGLELSLLDCAASEVNSGSEDDMIIGRRL